MNTNASTDAVICRHCGSVEVRRLGAGLLAGILLLVAVIALAVPIIGWTLLIGLLLTLPMLIGFLLWLWLGGWALFYCRAARACPGAGLLGSFTWVRKKDLPRTRRV